MVSAVGTAAPPCPALLCSAAGARRAVRGVPLAVAAGRAATRALHHLLRHQRVRLTVRRVGAVCRPLMTLRTNGVGEGGGVEPSVTLRSAGWRQGGGPSVTLRFDRLALNVIVLNCI